MTETHPQNRRLGYAGVSTYGQTLGTQPEQLHAAGCTKIYRKTVTGAHKRPARASQDVCRPHAWRRGDADARIDRLARSTFDQFAIVKQIVDGELQFRSLAEPWAEYRHRHRATDDCCAGRPPNVERDLIRTLTTESGSRAQKRARHMGQPSKITDARKMEAGRRRVEGATLAELARRYGVGKSTISRLRA